MKCTSCCIRNVFGKQLSKDRAKRKIHYQKLKQKVVFVRNQYVSSFSFSLTSFSKWRTAIKYFKYDKQIHTYLLVLSEQQQFALYQSDDPNDTVTMTMSLWIVVVDGVLVAIDSGL